MDKEVVITAGAEANISTELKLFWNVPCRRLKFLDTRGNRVDLMPSDGAAIAYFRSGYNLTMGLPETYKNYSLHIRNSVSLSIAELDYIYRWTNVGALTLIDENDLPHRLTLRPYKMRGMSRLWFLRFSVNQGTFAKLAVWKFLKGLPALEVLQINVNALNLSQIKRFVRNQGTLKEWEINFNETNLEFRKIVPETEENDQSNNLLIQGMGVLKDNLHLLEK